jgi:glycosyltransferase involved in cell wall biosynthesis
MRVAILHEVSYLHKPVYEYQDFAERLVELGHDVTVIDFDEAHYSAGYQTKKVSKTGLAKINLITLPNHKILGLGILWAKISFYLLFRDLLSKRQFDAVLVYSVFVNGANAVSLCRKFHVPVIYRVLDAYHRLRKNSIESFLLKLGEKSIYQNANFLAVTNQKMVEYVHKIARNSCAPTVILDHGVDTSHFRPIKKNQTLEKQLNIKKNALVSVFLGTTYSFTRLDEIIKQIPYIRSIAPNFVLMILGSGELDGAIINAINQLEDKHAVIQCGMISYEQLPDYLSLAAFAINPFEINEITREIIPIKLLQYLSSGLPVVSTPLPDVVKNFPSMESGIIYSKSDDLSDWIGALVTALNGNELIEYKKNTRAFVSKYYSINSAIINLDGLMSQLILASGI